MTIKEITSVDKDLEKGNSHTLLVGIKIENHMAKSMVVSQKIINRITI